jgi:hypothetical protein
VVTGESVTSVTASGDSDNNGHSGDSDNNGHSGDGASGASGDSKL